jgi:hypothetical protein
MVVSQGPTACAEHGAVLLLSLLISALVVPYLREVHLGHNGVRMIVAQDAFLGSGYQKKFCLGFVVAPLGVQRPRELVTRGQGGGTLITECSPACAEHGSELGFCLVELTPVVQNACELMAGGEGIEVVSPEQSSLDVEHSTQFRLGLLVQAPREQISPSYRRGRAALRDQCVVELFSEGVYEVEGVRGE